MEKDTKEFFESLLKEMSEMPIEKLKAAYVPSSNTECPDLLVKGKPLILELPEPTININYNIEFKTEYSSEFQKSKADKVKNYPNQSVVLNTSDFFPAVS